MALPEGELVVNSSQGGGSKDTWVLFGNHDPAPEPEPADATQVMKVLPLNDLTFEQSPTNSESSQGYTTQQGQQQQGRDLRVQSPSASTEVEPTAGQEGISC